jgi:RHH-type proline utilization regulon transcriptional repressor/proline dehydrogenase/delta 1-pyrroline-5-carboxylate dehydrogenase
MVCQSATGATLRSAVRAPAVPSLAVVASLDAEVAAFAREVAAAGAGAASSPLAGSWWSEKLLDRAMENAGFRTQLFRFVDVFPAALDDADVLAHLDEYLAGSRAPRALRLGVELAEAVPALGARVTAAVARRNIRRLAEHFIVGTDAPSAVRSLEALWEAGSAATVDLLGEKTVVEVEADRYAARVAEVLDALVAAAPAWPSRPVLEADDLGPLPRVNVSVKPSALSSHYAPLTREAGLAGAADRLRPLLRTARDRGAFVNLDMEHHESKDITLELLRSLLDEPELADVDAGVAVQAYLRESFADLSGLLEWSAGRRRPVAVRLVKGAYWDTETVLARAAGWPVPVFEDKASTDASYERCVRLLHDAHGSVRAAFASHNLRSLAVAVVEARRRGIPDDGYELQVLAGMGESIRVALGRLGFRVRVYAPVGDLVPGMAYLVRRLLENTSNEGFVRQRVVEGTALEELVRPPRVASLPGPPPPAVRPDTDPDAPDRYAPEPVAEWHRAGVRSGMGAALVEVGWAVDAGVLQVPGLIGDERVRTGRTLASVDPDRPDVVVAEAVACGATEADAAVAAARQAAEAWRRTPATERAAVAFRAAAELRHRRAELAALEVREAGKPWGEADADVCEAIDFCEYYGREALRLEERGATGASVQSPPGEANRLTYVGRGVAAVIAPWNFPLAIPCGMTMAALVAGNAVVLKPAEQTPAVAWQLVEALHRAGLPPGVLSFLPGLGEEVGARLVGHPGVDLIAFTGSREVGLGIVAGAAVHRPGARSVKRVIAEMGGKNPLIVDDDADLDVAVPAAVTSAFGYSGQKCSAVSRLIVLQAVYDEVVARLVGAAQGLAIGPPATMGTQVGPLIDAEAHKRVARYAEAAAVEGRLLLARNDVPATGYYVGPMVVEGLDPATSTVAREEVFGPLLAVFAARDLDHAIALANDTDFALTAGIVSRSPTAIAHATAELRAGNVYVNRATTGAVVGRQPFGGWGLSGVGSKAGGPDYLLQFTDPRAVTESTLRQGFVPPEDL